MRPSGSSFFKQFFFKKNLTSIAARFLVTFLQNTKIFEPSVPLEGLFFFFFSFFDS